MSNQNYRFYNGKDNKTKKEDEYYKKYDNYFRSIFNANFFSNLY
jgi:hypothetical protein